MNDSWAVQPGWYPDPQDEERQRYWDGNIWTAYVAGWFPDPADATLERYHNGVEWVGTPRHRSVRHEDVALIAQAQEDIAMRSPYVPEDLPSRNDTPTDRWDTFGPAVQDQVIGYGLAPGQRGIFRLDGAQVVSPVREGDPAPAASDIDEANISESSEGIEFDEGEEAGPDTEPGGDERRSKRQRLLMAFGAAVVFIGLALFGVFMFLTTAPPK